MIRRFAVLLALLALPCVAQAKDFIWYTGPTPVKGASGWTFDAPILTSDGTAPLPSYSFASDPSLGISKAAANAIGISVSGVLRWYWNVGGHLLPNATNTYDIGSSSINVRVIYGGITQGSRTKALTDAAAAASVVRIAVATNSYIGGRIQWAATSTDGTDQLATSGEQFFSGVDKAGTVTCGTGAALGTATAYTTAKTLVCTVTVATATTNCDIQVTCTNDTAGTQAIAFNYRLDMPLVATVTPQ
jgi:hypothetical protein